MNGQVANSNGRRRRDPDDLSVKLSTIRIWMHEKDIGKLTRVLWAGQGNRLRQQASTNPKVKRFLTAVPYVMNSIKDVHQAVIDNSLETLQANLEPPVPPALVTCRDANGLNLIHKAAGLGHATILEYLITTWPDGVHETDITGKTPLHWAASAKNNMRCYTLLTQAGCDEEAVDYKMKTPSFYRHKPHEIERAFLTYVPEAPRVSPDVATDWEALSDDSGDGKKLDIKIPEMNGFDEVKTNDAQEETEEQPPEEKQEDKEEESAENKDENEDQEEEAEKRARGRKRTKDEEPEVEAENVEETNENNEAETNNEADNETQNQEETENEPEPKTETEPEPEPESVEANVEETDIKNSEPNNEENLDEEELDGEGSPTSSLAIEGFVQGDAEDNTVQSQTAAYKLLNVEAAEPEIQAFLKNVPNYMNKIPVFTKASLNGSPFKSTAALDQKSTNGALLYMSSYLVIVVSLLCTFAFINLLYELYAIAARFPETTTVADNDGRTALHYAAVINDNGHFYNMGHTPEDYLGKEELKDTLSYKELLKRFGAEELEEKLLSDQGQIENQSCQENPIFKTEQGKYLAENLADPLIKALTQVAHKRPNDPLEYLTNYLQSYVSSRNTNGRTITQAAIHSGSSQTNSTVLASSKPSTPPAAQPAAQMQRQTARMNGHVKYANEDSIEEDSLQQLEQFDGDDGNDSDAEISKKLEERDEHGQSMLHFACARSHRKGGLIHLIEEAKADITYRDELYRTARDVALQANQLGNAKEIDRYVMSLAIVGDIKPFEHLAISGYDHIIDVVDDNETPIIDVVEARGLSELGEYLRTIRPLEELREELHQMIRDNNVERVKEIADGPDGKWLIKAKNYYGRTALHIAILKESVEIVEYFVNFCPEALKIGDNLERTALHYAMGTNIIESISRILIQSINIWCQALKKNSKINIKKVSIILI
ncbi:hypothetical protein CVS40_10124 [Lucilia cuprina]|nr:hypothetical protein CVS40_10124 [Lucilia cuprina]